MTGAILIATGDQLARTTSWLHLIPLNEIGGILIGAGVLSVWLDHFLRREQNEVDEHRMRHLLLAQAPAMRDAVLDAFAANHEDLARVASPEMLDQIISNSLALRLDDAQFASEVYADIRDQAVGAHERWHDASLSIELGPPDVSRLGPKTGERHSAQFFAVTVRWEYTTIPHHAQRRFVCVSDRDEYAELAGERSSTSAWYLKPTDSVDAGKQEAFELLRFAVNGEQRPIRRSVRKSGQMYAANVGADHIDAGEPITISYTYRTITTQAGHLLFFDIEQPTRDLRVDFDYTNCDIASVSTLDLVPSIRPTRIERPVDSLPGKVIRVDLDGWIFPRSGIAFVWTLDREAPTGPRSLTSAA